MEYRSVVPSHVGVVTDQLAPVSPRIFLLLPAQLCLYYMFFCCHSSIWATRALHWYTINPNSHSNRSCLIYTFRILTSSSAFYFCIQTDLESLDPRGRTPLHLAVTLGHLDCARVLLQHGADVSKENRNGWTGEWVHMLCGVYLW